MSHIHELKHTLKTRHITMIALGGVIGAGLFVGSGALIANAGPAAILSYLIGGVIVTLVMFMLGEMAVRNPDSGSFSTYASAYLGEWAGYSVGWLYWFKWMITMSLEALLLGEIVHDFFPLISFEMATFALLISVLLMNIYSVRAFGELEYWLSFLKVTAIVLFLGLGVFILLGFQSNIPAPGLTNLTLDGGFMPNGIVPVLTGVTVVIFAFGGSEIAAIAAGESDNPKKNVVRAIRSVVFRVSLFYVGSVAILILCLPWTDTEALKSPYVKLFSLAGFPAAATMMKLVLFISFISVMNSGMYTASRMLYSLSQRGYAPEFFYRTTIRGAPCNALMLSFVISSFILIIYFLHPGDFFLVLAKGAGTIIIVVWLFIVVAHWAMRRQLAHQQNDEGRFKTWFYPYSNWFAVATLMTVLLSQATNATMRIELSLTFLIVVTIIASYFLLRNRPQFGVPPQ